MYLHFPPLLHSSNSCTLEAQICFEVLRNFLYQILEGNFVNREFSGLLITFNFMECLIISLVMMRFLHPSSRGCTLMSSFYSPSFLLASPLVYVQTVGLVGFFLQRPPYLPHYFFSWSSTTQWLHSHYRDPGATEAGNTVGRWLTLSLIPNTPSPAFMSTVSQSHTVYCISSYQLWLLSLLWSPAASLVAQMPQNLSSVQETGV